MSNAEGSSGVNPSKPANLTNEQMLQHCSHHLATANGSGDLIFKENLEHGCGAVWLGILHKSDVIIKAVKRPIARNSQEHMDAAKEVVELMGMQHPHIVDYKGCLLSGEDVLWVVIGFCSKKTLHQRIMLSGISARYALGCAIDVAHALDYLHNSKNVVHNNLRPENLFLNARGRVRLGGFRHAWIPGLEKRIVLSGMASHPTPEAESKLPPSRESDIYFFGQLLLNIFPIETSTGTDSQRKRCAVTTRCVKLASQCQNGEPDARPTVKKILAELEAIRKGPGSKRKHRSSHTSREMGFFGCMGMGDWWENFLAVVSCGCVDSKWFGHSGQGYSRLLLSEASEESSGLLGGIPGASGEVPVAHNSQILSHSPKVVVMRDVKDFNGSKKGMESLCPIMMVDYGPPSLKQRMALENYKAKHLRPDQKRLPEFDAFLSADLLDPQKWKDLVIYFFGPRTEAFRASQHWTNMRIFFLKQAVPSIFEKPMVAKK